MTERLKTVFDKEPSELAERLRDAADAVESGGAINYVDQEHGDVDDGPVMHTVFVQYMEFIDDE